MKKILAIVLALAMVFGLAACAAAPAKEGETKEETKKETKEETKPSGTDHAPEVESEEEANVQFAFVQTMVHPFYEPMGQAMQDAAADLGIPEVQHLVCPEATVEAWSQIVDTLIARDIGGIFTQYLNGSAVVQKSIELSEAGIPQIGIASNAPEDSACELTWCTDVGQSAYEGALALIDAMGGKGNIVHLTCGLVDPNTTARIEGVEKAVAENPGVTLIQTIGDIDDTELSQNAVNNLLSTGVEVDGFIATGGGVTTGMCAALRQNNIKNIKAIGCDTDDVTLAAIKDGFITGTMYQNAYAQGYFAICSLYYYANGYEYVGEKGYQDSGFGLINIDNMDNLEQVKLDQVAEMKGNIEKLFVKK